MIGDANSHFERMPVPVWAPYDEAGRLFGINRPQLIDLAVAGKVRAKRLTVKQRGKVLFNMEDLDRAINEAEDAYGTRSSVWPVGPRSA